MKNSKLSGEKLRVFDPSSIHRSFPAGFNCEVILFTLKNLFVFLCLAFTVSRVIGQGDAIDSVMRLPVHEVSTSRLDDFSTGQKVRRMDSISVRQSRSLNLGEVMQRFSAVQVNTYTQNGLSTVAFRGTSPSHTGFLWNGFQMNPPNNGQLDLSLIPAGYFDDVKIYHGGNSALYGNGNIGGSIHLYNQADFRKHLQIGAGLHAGSFHELGGRGSVSFSNGKVYTNTLFLGKKAQNDFPYSTLQGDSKNMENSALQQFGLMQDIYFNAGDGWVWGISLWLQENNKEIPATLTTKPSDAWQKDRSARTMATVKKQLSAGMVSVKTALLYDYLHYVDPDTNALLVIDSEIKTLRSQTEAQIEREVSNNVLVNGGFVYTAEKGETGYYSGAVTQQQLGLFAQWRHNFPAIDWKLNVNLRQDFIEHYKVPFTPAIGMEGVVYKILSAKLNVSRNFRVPTFNDRYWVPGGNEELVPESSWNEELSLLFDMYFEKFRNKTLMTFTVYNSNVNNWILWVPDGALWSAENIQNVWSRGLEAEYKSVFSVQKVKVQFIGGYTYAQSTNQSTQEQYEQVYGKQLIYIPLNRYFFSGSLIVGQFVLNYNQSRMGERYVTRDNSETMPGYTVGNMSLMKTFHWGDQFIDLSLDVLNIWDAEYQSVQYNPMPGRNYKFTVFVNFNKQQNEENEN